MSIEPEEEEVLEDTEVVDMNTEEVQSSEDGDDSGSTAASDSATDSPEDQSEARRMGWRPKDEFTGPEGKWRSATEFLRRGKEEPALLNSRIDKLDESLKRERQENKRQQEQFKAQHESMMRMQKVALERQRDGYLGQIEAQKRIAAEEGDTEAYDQHSQAERRAKDAWKEEDIQADIASKTAVPDVSNDVQSWLSENSWYGKDLGMSQVAQGMENRLATESPGMSDKDRLREVSRQLRAVYPKYFGEKSSANTAAKRTGSPVESSTRTQGSAGAAVGSGDFAKLPQEARKQFEAFVEMGVFKADSKDKKEYASEYFKGL